MSLLDKYELGEVLSDGESRTRKARDIASGGEVLVHQLSTGQDRGRGTDLLRMIHRLLRGLPRRAHNPILDLGEHDGSMWLVTEAIPGFVSVRSWLEQQLEPAKPSFADAAEQAGAHPVPSPGRSATVEAAPPAPPAASEFGQLGGAPIGAGRQPSLAQPHRPPDLAESVTAVFTPPAPAAATSRNAGVPEPQASFEVTRVGPPVEAAGPDDRTFVGAPAPPPAATQAGISIPEPPPPIEPGGVPADSKTTILPAAMLAKPPEGPAANAPRVQADRALDDLGGRGSDRASPEPPRAEAGPPGKPPASPAPGEFTKVFQGFGVPVTFHRPAGTSGAAKIWKPVTPPGEFTQALQAPSAPDRANVPAPPSRDLPEDLSRRESGGEFSKIFGTPLDDRGGHGGLGFDPGGIGRPVEERPQGGEFTRVFGAARPPDRAVSAPEPPPAAGQAAPLFAAPPAPSAQAPPTSAAEPPRVAVKFVPPSMPAVAPPSFSPPSFSPPSVAPPAFPAMPAAPQVPPPPTPVQFQRPAAFTPPAPPAIPQPAMPAIPPPAISVKAPAARRRSYLPLIIVIGCVLAAAGLILYFALHH